MGRHYRDEEPVPHPQDRTPRAPAEGRSEASGAFRTPGRSSISDAFGIAGRGSAARPSGSVFFTEGAEAPGFAPEKGAAQPAARRGEASGAYPAARRGEAPAAPPVTRRGEASGAYPVTRRGEASGPYPAASRDEASGAYPAAGRDETSGAHPAASRDEATGAYPVGGRDEGSGPYPVAGRGESTVTRAPRRGEASGAYPVTSTEATTILSPQRGEASGAYPVTAETTTRSRREGGDSPAPDRVEAPVSRRAARRAEASGAHPVAGPAGTTTGRRSRRKAAEHPESAAERTEIITRQDDDVTLGEPPAPDDSATRAAGRAERGDTTGPQRAGRADSTGPSRTARSEGTGSHRIVGKSDVTGSHRIVGKKAPRRRIATWPIACLVLAVLIGLGIVGWNWADNELNSRAEAQAASCDGGTTHMRVVVTPSAQKPVAAAADRWNQAATVVHGQCVHVMIEAKPSAQVLDALVGRANMDAIGGLPAAWLPESTYWVSELTTKKPEMIGSPAQSVANARSADYPFIGLAGPGIDDTALRAAQTFREYLEQPAQQADFAAAGIKST
ncbi:hypothetical protein [Amycolatopsis rifamycinica]|uniref:Uncharacterized protein n=1 Tax=Amycolatopsis rifamycinica TaxID=287986 RepID=A0A066U5T5_9PSEU|nr:hypothetical protein [Amycolatopsis rifamycinica]KDN19494.1 hypothetical protein DV20_24430 [Amycolatopsis rifamycinica]